MKTIFSVAVCFLSLNAMAQDATKDALIADYERSKAMTLAYIEAMPEDKFDFKPSPESMSFADQMLHIAQGTIGLSANGTGAERIYADVKLTEDPAFKTKGEVTRLVTEAMDFAIKGINEMDGTTFGEVVERGPFKVTRLGWIQKANEHTGHHRGQCASYLRQAGVTPPQYKLF
ncbi:MAG: DinB family protein [Cyclobacteriaceae bacterium]|nr:DinB family protein [Cyclobacteriaceae bacterium]